MEGQSAQFAKMKENTPIIKSVVTESMVTVRLSDTELGSLPSPTSPAPTLMLVDEKSEEYSLTEDQAFVTEQPESPTAESMVSRRDSADSQAPANGVDWDELERSEGEHIKDESSEEQTAFLLARLENENKRLEKDPKALHIHPERPPSLAQLRRLMDNPDPKTLRYSMLPSPPPLTDLDFYAAVVTDYNRAASKLPFLLSKKIREGIPPPLRGVVWISMSGARDSNLEGLYDQLLGETSPYEHLIGKDIGRTGLEMFRQEGGEGQKMLGRVLRAFSIYDTQIGYCQGFVRFFPGGPTYSNYDSLGFLVGPLLMHMGEKEAFCVLVRLMEHYDLRSCFLPNMYGLHLRMYQFTHLLASHLPELSNHLNNLGIQPTYATQWFLSFFAVTCPLPMLLRIYDVIFAEGAPETIMRVALSLMKRNQKKLLGSSEFEDVMQMLLSRGLWDSYGCNANDLVNDFVGLQGMVTQQILADLEKKFKEEHPEDTVKVAPKAQQGSDLQAAAARFLGRLWGGPSATVTLSPASGTSRPNSILMRRTPSKQSLSTVSSLDASEAGSVVTDATTMSRCSSVTDDRRLSTRSVMSTRKPNKDGELHGQIEDLLTALSALQREHAARMDELEALKAERQTERTLTKRLIELLNESGDESVNEISELCDQITENIEKAESEAAAQAKSSTAQLKDELLNVKEQLHRETARAKSLSFKLAEQDADVVRLRSQLLDTRGKWQEMQKEKQQLQKALSESRQRRPSRTSIDFSDGHMDERSDPPTKGGLRELRLGRSNSTRSVHPPSYSKRASSLGMSSILGSPDSSHPSEKDALLLELVASKTAEAVAKQEAEEAKAKLEALRKVLGSTNAGSSIGGSGPLSPRSTTGFSAYLSAPPQPATAPATNSGGGGFWGGWGKRAVSAGVDSR